MCDEKNCIIDCSGGAAQRLLHVIHCMDDHEGAEGWSACLNKRLDTWVRPAYKYYEEDNECTGCGWKED